MFHGWSRQVLLRRSSTMSSRNAGLITIALSSLLAACMAGDEGDPADRSDELGQVDVNAHEDLVGSAFVHLFEWRWSDVAAECESFLGPRGFEAVQVSPPNEHIDHPTWWARYQPVSYQIQSRSGTRAQFIDMVNRCDAAGVAVYADAVINHTAALNGGGTGVAGTPWTYKNHPMYGPQDYHSTCTVNNYADRGNVQNCELVGLPDLDTGASYVQDTLAAYLNDLRGIGVAGFRMDGGKHMAHGDIAGILGRAGNPYAFIEVIGAAGEAVQPGEYTYLGQVTEFGYSQHVGHRFKQGQIRDLQNIGDGKLPSLSAVVFVDNHDNQRGHGAGGVVVTYKDGALYNLAVAFMLAHPYGYPSIMSSYDFTDSDHGPPAPGGCSAPGWVCEHRWTTIANMVGFRNATSGQPLSNWWDNGNNRIAFGRGNKGFIVINKESGSMDQTLQTGLPAGEYCNIARGELSGGTCTGGSITVDASGNARFIVAGMEAAAIHAGAMGSGGGGGGQVNVAFYAVGSIAALGSWAPASARKLDPTAYPTWTGTLSMPASTTIEWKCIKRSETNPTQDLVWEPGANTFVATPASGSASTTGSF
jgi:alpha-amylase